MIAEKDYSLTPDYATRHLRREISSATDFDLVLISTSVLIVTIGLVIVASASVTIAELSIQQPFYYLTSQLWNTAVGFVLAFTVTLIKLEFWQKARNGLLVGGVILLILVLVPILSHKVNGSSRWITVRSINFQPSEFVKLIMIIYLSGYLVRYTNSIGKEFSAFLRPLLILSVIVTLLFLEPDFGAAVIISFTVLGLLFLAGVPLRRFLFILMPLFGVMFYLVISSPYRLKRILSFVDPWDDPFDSDFQLSQALIAFGRGEWFGVGLGESVQKLFYIPEAHTDFIFAVLAEETGFFGSMFLIVLYMVLITRMFSIARKAAHARLLFASYLAHGIAMWIGLQTIINIGVNVGVLPTKGLTLPLMSYGGSSMLVTCVAIGLILRVNKDTVNIGKNTHE